MTELDLHTPDDWPLLEHPQGEGTIRGRLLSPERRVDLNGLCENWFATDIVLRVDGAAKMVGDPGLPGRVRGAFGAQLLESASPQARAGDPCPWDPPCTFEALFRKQGRMEKGFEFPAPWIILTDTAGTDLLVTLRLFGFAAEFAPAASEALASAIRKRLDVGGNSGFFLPKTEIVSRRINAEAGLSYPDDGRPVALEFLLPVAITGGTPLEKPRSLLSTLAVRAVGLARWHDLELETDRDEFARLLDQVEFHWQSPRKVSWLRGSNRQGKLIPMNGLTGLLAIDGPPEPLAALAPLIAIGQNALMGADVAFGCGRFEIIDL